MADPDFIITPFDIIKDRRLNAMDIRVLLALLSYRNKNTDLVWPSRAALSERTGYTEQKISNTTTRLAELGWVEKVQSPGRGNQYKITVPDLEQVPDPGTYDDEQVPEYGTYEPVPTLGTTPVPDPGTTPVPEVGTTPVPTSGTRNRQRNRPKEQTSGTDHSPRAYSAAFERFWKVYPKKVGKGEAWRAWQKLRPNPGLADAIVSHVEARVGNDRQWNREGGRYIPNGSTFLNQARFEDEWEQDRGLTDAGHQAANVASRWLQEESQ